MFKPSYKILSAFTRQSILCLYSPPFHHVYYRCDDCSIAFRIHGHLAKHLRSKVHITKLESLGKVPVGTFDLLERTCFRGVVATDCESALDSILKLVAKKLGVVTVSPTATITMMSSGQPVVVSAAPAEAFGAGV